MNSSDFNVNFRRFFLELPLGFLKFTRIKNFLNCNTIPRDRFFQTGRDTGSRPKNGIPQAGSRNLRTLVLLSHFSHNRQSGKKYLRLNLKLQPRLIDSLPEIHNGLKDILEWKDNATNKKCNDLILRIESSTFMVTIISLKWILDRVDPLVKKLRNSSSNHLEQGPATGGSTKY